MKTAWTAVLAMFAAGTLALGLWAEDKAEKKAACPHCAKSTGGNQPESKDTKPQAPCAKCLQGHQHGAKDAKPLPKGCGCCMKCSAVADGVKNEPAKDAAPGKEVAFKGTILCAKCALKEAKTCTTAIQVKEGDKTVTYYLDDKGHSEKYHEPVCGGERKEGTVTGAVFEKDGKKWIKPSKVEYAKK